MTFEPKYQAIFRKLWTNEQVDATDWVAKMYDLISKSMDYGSGFLDSEEYQMMTDIGLWCGFQVPECHDYWPHVGDVTGNITARTGEAIYLQGSCTKHKMHPGLCEGQIRVSGDPAYMIPVSIAWVGKK